MGNFNVKQKLGFLIFFSILMLVVVGLAGLSGARRIESALTVMSEEKLPTANALSNNSGAETISQTNVEMAEIAKTVQSAGQNINEVGVQSNKISMIVQVIKDVADQTNLLALNAAIEAARAGEQGRGFAVVADEVRKLAERTASSTTDISKVVSSMQSTTQNAVVGMESVVQRVDVGNKLSDQAAGRVGEIQGSAQHVAEAINDISVALNEQNAVAQDITRRVETVARMSEENSFAAKNTAQVAEELDQLADALRQTAGRFKV